MAISPAPQNILGHGLCMGLNRLVAVRCAMVVSGEVGSGQGLCMGLWLCAVCVMVGVRWTVAAGGKDTACSCMAAWPVCLHVEGGQRVLPSRRGDLERSAMGMGITLVIGFAPAAPDGVHRGGVPRDLLLRAPGDNPAGE